ncbi:MAG: hypothetical protein ACRDPI_08820 [Nocardioidaceae bacterium]
MTSTTQRRLADTRSVGRPMRAIALSSTWGPEPGCVLLAYAPVLT